jgi:hypothetical protein
MINSKVGLYNSKLREQMLSPGKRLYLRYSPRLSTGLQGELGVDRQF